MNRAEPKPVRIISADRLSAPPFFNCIQGGISACGFPLEAAVCRPMLFLRAAVLHELRLETGGNLLDSIVEESPGLFEQTDDVVVAEHGGDHDKDRQHCGQEGAGAAMETVHGSPGVVHGSVVERRKKAIICQREIILSPN